MQATAAITVLGSREDVMRAWHGIEGAKARFADAPGDRGTEIHAELEPQGTLSKLKSPLATARVKDELRRFKQQFETGEIPRSDGAPEGERIDRMFKQRPAQPLPESERQAVVAR
jgi:uncharacterized membrane protein